jgi:hypothetical protein
MTEVEHFIERQVIPHLPSSVRAVSYEINAWLVNVHAFQHGFLDDQTYERMEVLVEPLKEALPPRNGEPWQVTVTAHRVDIPEPIPAVGTLVYPTPA